MGIPSACAIVGSWLRHAATAAPEHVIDRVLVVCPAGPAALPPGLAPFHDGPLDPRGVRASARCRIELVCTDAGPWCPEGAAALYGRALELSVHVVPRAGHLSLDAA
jgi:hypothetical protein